tara:strand:+ start:1091 stop:1297 length:207 start_codon:yes stop_codon:yes gene_type:complete
MVDISDKITEQVRVYEGDINTIYIWVCGYTDNEWAIGQYYDSIEKSMAKLLYWYDMEEYFELTGEDNE